MEFTFSLKNGDSEILFLEKGASGNLQIRNISTDEVSVNFKCRGRLIYKELTIRLYQNYIIPKKEFGENEITITAFGPDDRKHIITGKY